MYSASGITFSGLGSGLDYSSWISQLVEIKQAQIDSVSSQVGAVQNKETALSGLKTNYSSLLNKIDVFTDPYSSSNVFNQKTATSSSTAVSASVTSSATPQNLNISVSSLATATVAKSTDATASAITSTTKIGDISAGTINAGTFKIFKDGKDYSFAVDTTTTLGDLLTNIQSSTGLNATVDAQGKVSIGAGSSSDIVVGSNVDTSNITNVLSLVKNTDGSYSSSKPIFSTNTNQSISTASFAKGVVTTGTFTIGNAQFNIDSTTTMNDLINSINNNKDAGATASWDANAGKFVLTANDQGAKNIYVAAGTSNFTDIMGLTNGGTLVAGAQTLGSNAVLSINGTSITSSSNTVTSDVTGITGLTLKLNDTTTSPSTVSIMSDTGSIKTAVTDFVNAFNNVMTKTTSATSTDGTLYDESILNRVRDSLRGEVTQSTTNSGIYKTLADIGITTGAVGSSTSANTNLLVVDTSKLDAALKNDPASVQKVLTGDNSKSGILGNLQTTLISSLDPINGYFSTENNSYTDQISSLNDEISRMNYNLQGYKAGLEKKFSDMDKLISALQSSSLSLY